MRCKTVVGLAVLIAGGVARADVDPKIERVWRAKCASCHGDDGKAQTEQGKKMGIADLAKTTSADTALKDAILKGIKRDKDGKKQEMEAYAEKLKAEQIEGLMAKVKSFK